jgi:hypothetical protein
MRGVVCPMRNATRKKKKEKKKAHQQTKETKKALRFVSQKKTKKTTFPFCERTH